LESSATRAAPTGLDEAGELQIHGSLVDVGGLGVLLLGPSGVGTSECVIELVRRGHRLVADDIVRLRTRPGEGAAAATLLGWAPEHIRHYVEVRGLGLMCVADLFGSAAIRDRCEVGFIIRLEAADSGVSFERIGLERPRERLLGVEVPAVRLPVHAASNLATLVELAVRDWQLRLRGVNAAQRLDERLRRHGAGGSTSIPAAAGDTAPGEEGAR